jgi:uncharacterized RDD family membrane protein YckC
MTDNDLQNKRLMAAAIDIGAYVLILVVFWIISMIVGTALGQIGGERSSVISIYGVRLVTFVGSLLVLGYVLGRDMIASGRSFGKQLVDIRVLTPSGGPIGFEQSARRNAVFAVGAVLGVIRGALQLIPCLGDAVVCLMTPLFVLSWLFGIAAVIVEIIKITQDPAGVRFGDEWGGTRVVR